ncbi:MAG: DUF5110 domain-containing protein [Gemmatimonadaceae bacterium]|nr:DUF5110 domain-containing protein [Gloeobacterales cyanobacterium ES-bin-141]
MDFQQVGNRIVCANARFSALADGLVRLEWSASGQFEDRPTLMAITRPEPVAFASVESVDGVLHLSTGVIEIVYQPPGPFDDANLQIHWQSGHSGTWSPLTVDTQNLGGTFASLDLIHRLFKPEGVHTASVAQRYAHTQEWIYAPMKAAHQYLRDRGETTRFEDPPLWYLARHHDAVPPAVLAFLQEWRHFPPGLLSESGYSVLDDSDGAPLEAGQLSLRAEGDGRDWYFFAYGSSYKQALADFTRLCGRIPMLPRWAFGVWFSLFDDMHDEDYRKLVGRFAELELPLDVLILDVDWHLTGWCGWEWNRELFPDPGAFLQWAHNAGLHLGANVHIEGVPPGESRFDALARARGLDPADVRAGKVFAVKNPTVDWIFDSWQPDESGSYKATAAELEEGWLLFNLAEPEEAHLFMEMLHGPREEEGIDFWWIDGANATHPGVNSQLWTNHVYYTHLEAKTNRRAMILARTGGLGSHRYPAQFSADTYSHWEVLQLLVDFTARAGNVGVAYWSHDLGGFYGHIPGVPTIDPELFVRWVQFGCWSPLVRLHSDHGLREPWAYGRWVLEALRKAMRTRIEFVPYLYHLSRVAYDTGLPLCRPMYLGYPEESEAYRVPTQYLLGEGVLIAPVVEAGGYRQVWLPVGEWWARETHTRHSGPGQLDLWVRLDQVPVFVQAGTLLPLQPAGLRAGSAPSAVLVLEVYAGASGELDFYEDDGESTEYRTGPGSRRRFRQHREDDRDMLTCEPARGSYTGMPEMRDTRIRWIGLTGCEVKVEGAQVGELHWEAGVLEVFLPMVPQFASWSVVVQSR